MKLSKIKPNPDNPRIVKDDKFKKLVKSIKEFPKMMELRPMVIDSEGIVLGGNMRLKALKELGYKDIPKEWVKFAKDLTEEEKKRFIIADNVGFGLWNWEQLANEWNEQELIDWGLDIPDFEAAEELEAVEDDYSEPEQMQVDVVEGDLVEFACSDGRVHRLLCGDSTCSDSVGKLMDGKKADMVFTDPPYGYSYESNYYKKGNPFGMLENDNKLLDFLPNVLLYTKENAAVFVCTSFQTVAEWIEKTKEHFTYKNLIVWKKNNWSMGDLEGAFAGQHELIIFLHKGRILINGKRDTDIWEFNRQRAVVHPTQKPVELISFAIQKTTKPAALVLDLFLGSGSTLIAAHQLKRTCYGCELDTKYCQVIIDRMQKLDETLTVKINGKEYKKEGAEVPF